MIGSKIYELKMKDECSKWKFLSMNLVKGFLPAYECRLEKLTHRCHLLIAHHLCMAHGHAHGHMACAEGIKCPAVYSKHPVLEAPCGY